MECTCKKSDAPHPPHEIHVSSPTSGVGTIASGYDRFRFALLRSSWFPKPPLGFPLWSALHVLLVVGGAALMLLASAVAIAAVLFMSCCVLYGFGFCIPLVSFLVCAPCSLIWLLVRVIRGLMLSDEQRVKVAYKGFEAFWKEYRVVVGKFLAACKGEVFRELVNGACDVFELRGGWRLVGRWCEEVVHLHDTFVAENLKSHREQV